MYVEMLIAIARDKLFVMTVVFNPWKLFLYVADVTVLLTLIRVLWDVTVHGRQCATDISVLWGQSDLFVLD
jgi:hypothetical protein